MKTIAKIGILSGIGLLIYRWYKQAQDLIVGVESVTVKNIDLDNLAATIALNVEIENPLDFGVTVNGLTGIVYLQGVPVGAINAEYNYYISGKTKHIIPIYIHTTLKAMGKAIWDGLTSGNIKNMDLDVDAKIYATKLNIGVPVQLHWGTNELI